jgi:replicative DNA helicase
MPLFTKSDTVRVPSKLVKDDQGDVQAAYKEKPVEALDWRAAWKAIERWKQKVFMEDGLIKLSTHPNSTLTVSAMDGFFTAWENEGWIPDVIVVDYADILAPETKGYEFRNQVNETWKALRRLSQEKHCLVLTATQADADSYDKRTQTMKNFSEDKRKIAHVTGLIGLNQDNDEKKAGIMRLNWLALREGEFNPVRCVHVGQALNIGRPAVVSTW